VFNKLCCFLNRGTFLLIAFGLLCFARLCYSQVQPAIRFDTPNARYAFLHSMYLQAMLRGELQEARHILVDQIMKTQQGAPGNLELLAKIDYELGSYSDALANHQKFVDQVHLEKWSSGPLESVECLGLILQGAAKGQKPNWPALKIRTESSSLVHVLEREARAFAASSYPKLANFALGELKRICASSDVVELTTHLVDMDLARIGKHR